MDENKLDFSEQVSLTLDPFASEAAAVQEAPKAPEIALETEAKKEPIPEPTKLDESALTDAEKKIVNEFAQKIDITNSNTVLQYGAAAQQKIANFSDSALANVRTKDFGEMGDMLSNLIVELKGINDDEDDKSFKWFKKTRKKVEIMKANYDKAETSVNNIVSVLEQHQITLLKDIAMLDKMYEMNLAYFKELTMYIIAGKKKLAQERETTLVKLQNRARESGLPEDAQAANDFAAMCDRFEKKLFDLELTRVISIQMSPQIRLVQNNDSMMTEKIQSTIVNTIPLWKSQMVITLGIAHSTQAMKAQREVTNMTNELLKKNAESLRMGTVDIAKESERGIVDIETLTYTNQQLIATLDEVQQIQTEGREKRRAAEIELRRIEGELKQKLLNINN
jgi:Uncharacterized protein involved in tellurite resistance